MASSALLFGTPNLTLSRIPFKLHTIPSSSSSLHPPPLLSVLPPRPSLLSSQRWLRASGIARAEEKAKNASSSSPSPRVPEKDRGDYEELIDGSGKCDPLCSVDEVSSQDFEANYQPKTDLLKAFTILATTVAGAAAINHSWVAANQASGFALAGYAAGIVAYLGAHNLHFALRLPWLSSHLFRDRRSSIVFQWF